jgi:ABC-type ATPase involved in cell division
MPQLTFDLINSPTILRRISASVNCQTFFAITPAGIVSSTHLDLISENMEPYVGTIWASGVTVIAVDTFNVVKV